MSESLPGLQLVVHEGTSAALLDQLRAGQLDLVLARSRIPADDDALVERAVYPDDGVIVAGADHPLSRRQLRSADELRGYPWLLPPAGSPTRVAIDDALRAAGLVLPSRTLETFSMSFVTNVLNVMNLLTVLPASAAEPQALQGVLAKIDIAWPIPLPQLSVLRRKNGLGDPALAELEKEIALALPARRAANRACTNARHEDSATIPD
jgi:DNA-binding transcriptional LysR family regulator